MLALYIVVISEVVGLAPIANQRSTVQQLSTNQAGKCVFLKQ
jgi:hypothetical protein